MYILPPALTRGRQGGLALWAPGGLGSAPFPSLKEDPLSPEDTYELLRNLTSPIVAITCTWRGRHNGMVADSAVRASLSLRVPRVAVVIHRWNWSHDLVLRSGVFVLNLLHREQWDVVQALGFESGRERDKMAGLRYRLGRLGRPVLEDGYAYLECRVANAMDVGGSTMFLGDVVEADRGPGAEVMTAAYFRANQPQEWRAQYVERLRAAQAFSDAHASPLLPLHWVGPEDPQRSQKLTAETAERAEKSRKRTESVRGEKQRE